MSTCFVYIIAHAGKAEPCGPVKVGITKALGPRLAAIQTGNWHRVQFAQVFTMENRDLALEVERTFHDIHEAVRLNGEWFNIDPVAALDSLSGIVYATIEQIYPEDQCQKYWVESGAIDGMWAAHRGVLQ